MTNMISAVKRVRTTETAEARNISKKNAMRTAVKRAKTAISTDAENTNELLSFAIKQVDKAAKSNYIQPTQDESTKPPLFFF